jgi:primosomal protein N' (replication factor Y)
LLLAVCCLLFHMFAEVAVNSTMPHRQTFSYAVPGGLDVRPGHGVYVPFGRLTLQGIVVEITDTPAFADADKIRPLHGLIGDTPLLDEARIALAKWIAHEYVSPIFDAIALLLPPGFERRPVTFVRPLITSGDLDDLDLTRRQRDALTSIITAGRIDAERLDLPSAALGALERRGVIGREYELARPRIGAKTVEIASLAMPEHEARRAVDSAATPKHSRRAAVLERLIEKRRISEEEAQRLAGSRANLDRLIRAGDVRYDREGHSIDLAMAPAEAHAAIAAMRRTARASQALVAVDALRDHELELTELRNLKIETSTVRWLADLGVLALREEAVERDPLDRIHVERREPPPLLPAQSAAADAIIDSLRAATARDPKVFLLHGVTGSGKTEVYLAALDACVGAGRRGIVLVPEIALTPQTVRRFRERFERVAVLHSGLSDGERFDQWHGIAAGRYDVVIGARSAIFAPQPDLGLVVIDEEHEWTYKQHELPPRYHARDVAIERARLIGATVVLGSATPDVISHKRATNGDYILLELRERIRPVAAAGGFLKPQATPAMARVAVVDMREELKSGNRSMFSSDLRARLDAALAAREQAILFLNRRGLAGHVQCRDCGHVPACTSCGVALTFHRQYDRLVCHQCNRLQRLPAKCRQCGSPRVRLMGAGVEKVEAETKRVFPGVRTLRWDRDVTRRSAGRDPHEQILSSFLAGDADVLIGTQMLAKGLDLPSVTVVGVINADIGLHLPDFRAGERTFQLLTQVAGRAGRGERPGDVVIQTYQPEHYAVDAASRYDYEGFAAIELEARRKNQYPPFTRLARLMFSHTSPRSAREEASRVARALSKRRAEIGSDVQVVGPSPAYVPRLRGRWRWQLMLRGREPAALVRDFLLPPGWAIDIDPATLT